MFFSKSTKKNRGMNQQRRLFADTANVSTANVIIAGTQLCEIIILARTLHPADIGVIAIIAVILGLLRSLADLGTGNALIHFQSVSRAAFSSLYWLLITVGAAFFGAFAVGRSLFESIAPHSPLTPLLGWIGLNVCIYSIGILYHYQFQKEQRFRRIAIVESLARCLGTATVAVLALTHHGIFSYVAGQIVYSGVKSALLLFGGLRLMPLSPVFDLSALRPFLRFGAFQMGERVVTFFSANIDYLVIGKFLGAQDLGFYKIAYELVTVPLRLINPIFGTVALPRFAKKQHDDAVLRKGILSMLRLLGLVTFPLLFGLAAIAAALVPAVYGGGWDRVVPLVWLLTGMGLFKIIGNVAGTVLIAKGLVSIAFVWNCIISVGNLAAFLIAVRWGTAGVAAAYSVISLIYLLVSFPWYYFRTIGLTMRAWISSFLPFAAQAAAMGGIVYLTSLVLAPLHLPPGFSLSILIPLGILTYMAISIAAMKKERNRLWQGIRSGEHIPLFNILIGEDAG